METPNEPYQVIISAEAAQQLVAHAAFPANVSTDAAEQLVQSFESAAASLRSSPFRCPCLHGRFIPANTYRFLCFEKRYLLLFLVRDQRVYVDYVVDCRQDYQWLLAPR